jgi:hypothetical protein
MTMQAVAWLIVPLGSADNRRPRMAGDEGAPNADSVYRSARVERAICGAQIAVLRKVRIQGDKAGRRPLTAEPRSL